MRSQNLNENQQTTKKTKKRKKRKTKKKKKKKPYCRVLESGQHDLGTGGGWNQWQSATGAATEAAAASCCDQLVQDKEQDRTRKNKNEQ